MILNSDLSYSFKFAVHQSLPLTREVARSAGGREKQELSTIFSPPVSSADSPLVRGGQLGAAIKRSDKLEFEEGICF